MIDGARTKRRPNVRDALLPRSKALPTLVENNLNRILTLESMRRGSAVCLQVTADSAMEMDESRLMSIIEGGESQTVEFKSGNGIHSEVLMKHICAFANSLGGYVVFGVDDQGTIVGCKAGSRRRIESCMVRYNGTLGGLYPEVVYSLKEFVLEGKSVVCLNIPRGTRNYQYKGASYSRIGTSVVTDTIARAYQSIIEAGVYDTRIHATSPRPCSFDAAIEGVLKPFRDWVELNRGWHTIQSIPSRIREKEVQRLIHLCGLNYCENNDIDMSFEANEGSGPADLKLSRGNDKTVIEVKLSSNNDYINGFRYQIEQYARAENTTSRIYVYIRDAYHPGRDEDIQKLYEKKKHDGENPPYLFMINAEGIKSASKLKR